MIMHVLANCKLNFLMFLHAPNVCELLAFILCKFYFVHFVLVLFNW